MAKKPTTDDGTGRYGIAVELKNSISNNWFESEAARDENYKRLRSSGSRGIKKIKR